MLYCPKCRRTYEHGTQRFCDNDGGRLLPAPTGQKDETLETGGVFTNLLGKAAPRFVPLNKTEEADKKLTSFPSEGRIFQSERFLKPKPVEPAEDSLLELEPLPSSKEAEKPVLEFEPVLRNDENASDENPAGAGKMPPRLVRPNEIASGTADIGNRKTNPLGREALSWSNPEALLGQTVKGRYRIIEEFAEDNEESLLYLAEDKIVAGKKAVVRVFMNERLGEDFEDKIFAEERVSLSHLNHPNIAGVFDSGELPEGNSFIVSEFVEGESLAATLKRTGQFNCLRAARIVRQISYALSEAHQNGILHRNLTPENLMLTVSEAGIEQVKLMNFGVSRGEITETNLAYKAPEQIEKEISTFASDIYALAVIAYQMLTARQPFAFGQESELVRAQKAGLTLPPTALRLDIQESTDKILQKALAFIPSERYPKARDFGDALFNALTAAVEWSDETETKHEAREKSDDRREFVVVSPINRKETEIEESSFEADIHIAPTADLKDEEAAEAKISAPPPWEKRSPEPPQTGMTYRGWTMVLGIIALLITFWAASRLLMNRQNQPEIDQDQAAQNTVIPAEKAPQNFLPQVDGDIAPPPRLQTTPAGTVRFQNVREDLNENLARNFLGFEIFYPQDWTKNSTETNFLDISRRDSSGLPVEQLIVTRYESRGNMTLDRQNFPKLVEKSNQDLKKSLGETYRVVAEGETTIQNNRWKVYEVKFQSTGKNERGEDITVWGRRLWLPLQVAGKQNGFVLTLLATSLSDEVSSADEVGLRGELANVLETFEPEQQ